MDIENKLIECETCGGNLEYDDVANEYTCAYCGNVYAGPQNDAADAPADVDPMLTTQLFIDPDVFALGEFLQANLGGPDFPWNDLGPVLSEKSRITPEQYVSFLLLAPDCEEKRQCARSFLHLLSSPLRNCSCSIMLGGVPFVATPWHVYVVASSDCASTLTSIAAGMYPDSGQPGTHVSFGGRDMTFKAFVQENLENLSEEAVSYCSKLPSL